MNPAARLAWFRYRTGRWHLAVRSERGTLWVPCAVGPSPDASFHSHPGSRVCRNCMRWARAKNAPVEVPPSDSRARGAADYAADVLDGLPGCSCVRAWPGAREHVDGPFARWAAALFLWELTGASADRRDVEEAAGELRAAWRLARERYEFLDGSHPHRSADR